MVMVREVLTCRPGRVGELVEKFQALGEVMEEMGLEPFDIYTDIAGENFWTLVLQREYEDIGEVQGVEAKVMSDERSQKVMAGYHDLVESGRREIYKAVI